MDKKKKFSIVIMIPVIATVIIAGLTIYFVLQVGASGSGHRGVTYSPEMGQIADPADMTIASSDDATGEVPAIAEGECSFADWVGHAVNEDSVKATGRPYRILKPNAAATMDYSPERINIIVDDKDVVTAVRCG